MKNKEIGDLLFIKNKIYLIIKINKSSHWKYILYHNNDYFYCSSSENFIINKELTDAFIGRGFVI